jgi:hypothetical protein
MTPAMRKPGTAPNLAAWKNGTTTTAASSRIIMSMRYVEITVRDACHYADGILELDGFALAVSGIEQTLLNGH